MLQSSTKRFAESLYTRTDSPVCIRDVFIFPDNNRTDVTFGEFEELSVNQYNQLQRIFKLISYLIAETQVLHMQDNCMFASGSIQERSDRLNHITRALTPEFFFFSKKPLTLTEFEKLLNQICALIINCSDNLVLGLGTFAVRTPKNKMMNVFVHIECGEVPSFHCVAKRKLSSSDPLYTENFYGAVQTLEYVTEIENLEDCKLIINQEEVWITFNSAFSCMASGGGSYYFLVDICLDHKYANAQLSLGQNLQWMLEDDLEGNSFIQCSHIICSNTLSMHPENVIGSVFTQIDPYLSQKSCSTLKLLETIPIPVFGTPFVIMKSEPLYCSLMPARFMSLINQHALSTYGEENRVAHYTLLRLNAIGLNEFLNQNEKCQLAQKLLNEIMKSIETLDELEFLVNELLDLSNDEIAPLSYLKRVGQGFSNRFENVFNLIKRRASELKTSFVSRHPIFKTLYKISANLHKEKSMKKFKNRNGEYFIFQFIQNNDYVNLQKIVFENAPVNLRNHLHQTPLEMAIEKNNPIIVELLLSNGADPNIATSNNVSHLILVISLFKNDQTLFELLLKYDADPNQSSGNITPISTVIDEVPSSFKYILVKKLIEHGAILNKVKMGTLRLFEYALVNGDINLLELFMEHSPLSNSDFEQYWCFTYPKEDKTEQPKINSSVLNVLLEFPSNLIYQFSALSLQRRQDCSQKEPSAMTLTSEDTSKVNAKINKKCL